MDRVPAPRRLAPALAGACVGLLSLALVSSACAACDPPASSAPAPSMPARHAELDPSSRPRTDAPEQPPRERAPATEAAPAQPAPAINADDPAEAEGDEPTPRAEPAPTRPVREYTQWTAEGGSAKTRDRGAHTRRLETVKELFEDAGLRFPPKQLLLRAFKDERELEVWANDRRGDPLTHVATYRICAGSGELGPKKAEGDYQVPEGFYKIDLFNPRSRFHLSMRISYPNRRDRALGYTGSAIMIHGNCVSIGCLAMSDARMEELWVMTKALPDGERARVHLFPGRDLDGLIARETTRDPDLAAFWTVLKRGKDAFEADRRMPAIRVERGAYVFE